MSNDPGASMIALGKRLFPICRSLTGAGTLQTLEILQEHIPGLQIHDVESGRGVFDWTVPDEWNINSARLVGPDGQIVADFNKNNLHVVGYSEPIDMKLSLEELQPHLHSLKEQPEAIPYVTSYYKRYWGFCLEHRIRQSLPNGEYHAVIDSVLAPGHLHYGELLIPGHDEREIFVSTYVCHPSMANNELSGPLVVTWLSKYLLQLPRRFSYRIVFVPETIGSITYICLNLEEMKKRIIAGYNVSCVGDERAYSYLPSRAENTLADRALLHVLGHTDPDFIRYSFLDRGSDERQYCAPGVDLPVASVLRSKYGSYPEYHTSLDNFDLVTGRGLEGSLEVLKRCVDVIEANTRLKNVVLCEPQLGKRGLYPNISTVDSALQVRTMMNLLAYSDGTHDLISLAEKIGLPAWELLPIRDSLTRHGLLKTVD